MAEDKNKNKKDDVVRETPDGDMVVRTVGRDFRVEGNDVDGYIGVSSEYRNYANETEKPYVTDEDVELLTRTGILTDVETMTQQNAVANARAAEVKDDAGERDDEDGDESNDKNKAGSEAAKAGQGDTPRDPTSAATRTAGGRQAAGTSTSDN